PSFVRPGPDEVDPSADRCGAADCDAAGGVVGGLHSRRLRLSRLHRTRQVSDRLLSLSSSPPLRLIASSSSSSPPLPPLLLSSSPPRVDAIRARQHFSMK